MSPARAPSPALVNDAIEDVISALLTLRARTPQLLAAARHPARDAFPAAGDAGGSSATGYATSPVERAALARSPQDRTGEVIDRIWHTLGQVQSGATRLHGLLALLDALPQQADVVRERTASVCIACGRPAAVIKSGFCDDCMADYDAAGRPDRGQFIATRQRDGTGRAVAAGRSGEPHGAGQ